jgi:hypothetical protein
VSGQYTEAAWLHFLLLYFNSRSANSCREHLTCKAMFGKAG